MNDEDIVLEFKCPICESDSSYKGDYGKTSKYTCNDCRNQYFLKPVENPDGKVSELDIQEQLELQFKSVNIVHPLAKGNHDLTVKIASSPIVALLGVVAVIFVAFALFGIATIYQEKILTEPLFSFGFGLFIMGLFLGSTAVLYGPGGSVFNAYKLYVRYNPDCSIQELMYYSANYHKNKLL